MMGIRKSMQAFFLVAATTSAGCGVSSGETTDRVGLRAESALPAREGSVIIDGCLVDPWQRAVLAGPGARKVLRTVILLCLVPRLDGTVGPRDPSALAELARTADVLHGFGYRMHLAISFTDETGLRYDGAQTADSIRHAEWKQAFATTLPDAIVSADGVEIDLQGLPTSARQEISALVKITSNLVRPAKKLGVFFPPSVTTPSDLPNGDAFDRLAIAPNVDRMRLMTLDFSEDRPGPTIEPGWAVDAARLALRESGTAAVDVSYPLYGTDWGPRGKRSITWFDAMGISSAARAPIERGPTGAPFVRFTAFGGERHEAWFDDADSTGRALGVWTYDVLPQTVGVVFYGLGAEDPELFERLGARMP